MRGNRALAIVLVIIFFGSLTSLGLGIIGQYLWLTLQNTRRRPNWIVASEERYHNAASISALISTTPPSLR